jgi:NitT/TauT family transport system ATP-binding protein
MKQLSDRSNSLGPDRGVVFQQYALFPWKTAMANVGFGLSIKGAVLEAQNESLERR